MCKARGSSELYNHSVILTLGLGAFTILKKGILKSYTITSMVFN